MTAELAAGRELDALVAERLMGWTEIHSQPHPVAPEVVEVVGWPPDVSARLPKKVRSGYLVEPYSTDIAAAWQVVEHLKAGYQFKLEYDIGAERWDARVGYSGIGRADTAPLAICRAALAAVAGKEQANG